MNSAFAAVIFLVVLALIYGVYWFLIVRPETLEEQALRKRLKVDRKVRLIPVVKSEQRLSTVGALNTLLERSRSISAPLERAIDQSGTQITVGTIVLACAFLALAAAFVVTSLTSFLAAGAIVGFLAGWLPIFFLRYKANKRLEQFEEQFPEAIDLMARALRAGHALTTSLQMVAEEVPDPVGSEFRQLFEQQNFGMSLPDALRAFAYRVPVIDARFFVTALLTQRETGGNLSEVLDNLSAVIRERFKVKRQVRVMSAHGRITGWALGLMPPVLAAILFTVNPVQMRVLIEDPLGIYMVVGALVLQIIGVLAIRKIVNVEY